MLEGIDADKIGGRCVTPMSGNQSKRSSQYDRHIGGRLRSARQMRRLSQSTLAEKLGLTFQQVQKYERGDNRISAGRLYEIAAILGMDVAYFFEGLDKTAAPAAVDVEYGEALSLFAKVTRIKSIRIRAPLLALIAAMATHYSTNAERRLISTRRKPR